jgi:iron complex transport system ATP-binding protein
LSIEVTNLSFSYGENQVLDDINFTAQDNQLLSVLGPNGVGKTTLFRCILGLLTGYKGQILLDGIDIKGLGIEEMARLIAYIPQFHYPSFNYSVFDMVLMGTSVQVSAISSPGVKQKKLVDAALKRVGIYHLKNRGFTRISGGERQLVLLARALAQEAKILVMDEPTSNLDFGNQVRVLTEIKSLAKEGYTIIQSTHNPDQTFLFSDRVMAMKDGKVLAWGTPAEIYTEDLIYNLYGVEVEMESLYQDKARVFKTELIAATPRVALKKFHDLTSSANRRTRIPVIPPAFVLQCWQPDSEIVMASPLVRERTSAQCCPTKQSSTMRFSGICVIKWSYISHIRDPSKISFSCTDRYS